MADVPDLAAKRAALSPERIAFIDHESGAEWRFAAVDAQAARAAAALREIGLVRGDRIAVLCLNTPDFFIALFACQKAGLILAPLNWRQPATEIGPVLDSVGCAAIVHDAAHAAAAAALAAPRALPAIALGPLCALPESAVAMPPAGMDEDAPWYLLFTSGTTGTPKAVIQTPRMALANAMNVAQAISLTQDDRTVNYLPLFHTAGINLYTLPLFLWGGCSRVVPKFDPDTLLDLITAGAVTQFFGVPAIYQALLLHPRLDAVDFSAVKSCACGGAAMPEDMIRRFAARGALIRNGFGMTETGPMGWLVDAGSALARIGSIGKPQMMTEARLDGVAEGAAGTGELLIRGASVTPGYFGNPQATAAAFDGDGWLRSGDVASRDDAGYYRIIDRLKDMYISGGENVYPAEVERVLITHPDILEAAVVGVSDPRWGEAGVAFVIARPGRTIDLASLTPWLRERLAAYKLPRAWHVVDDFPRTPAGKTRKPELRKRLT